MNNISENKKIKVIVADDHPVFRNGMAVALKRMKFISKAAMASNGEDVISLLENDAHDLVLMDIRMKPMDGIETTSIIQKRFPEVKVIALSMYDDVRNVTGMFENGAKGYLLKNADSEEIETAIMEIMNGGNYYSKDISTILLNHVNQLEKGKKEHEESPYHKQKLREVIFLISYELTSEEIGKVLSLATRTIDDYRKEILNMTNSRNTVGIVKYALTNYIDQDKELITKFKKFLGKKNRNKNK